MFGFGFAMIPLYNVLCKNLGINGKTDKLSYLASNQIDLSRSIRVELMTHNNNNLAWNFYPRLQHIQLHPGENILIYFFAQNNSDHPMTVQAIPSVSPGLAARYLKKQSVFVLHNKRLMRANIEICLFYFTLILIYLNRFIPSR